MSLDAFLAEGDTNLSNAFNLHDHLQCYIFGGMFSIGRQSIPGGVNFGLHLRSVHEVNQTASPIGTEPIYIGVYLLGAVLPTLHAASGMLVRKAEQSAQGAGPQLLGQPLVFWYRRESESNFALYYALSASVLWVDTQLSGLAGYVPAQIKLDCIPYGHMPPITTDAVTGTLTVWTPGSQLYRAALPNAHVESLATIRLADLCTASKVITKVKLWTRHMQPMTSTDHTSKYAGVTNTATTLNGVVAAGVSSIVVTSATGFVAGALFIFDQGSVQELCTVAASYVSGTTIPLVRPLLFAHLTTVPIVIVVPGQAQLCSPATKSADATAANGGGNVARVQASASWQSLLMIVPNAGAVQNGRFAPIARIRDASAVLGTTQAASLTSTTYPVPVVSAGTGHLPVGTYTFMLVPKNGTNLGQPTGQVLANVANLQPGGGIAPIMNVLLFEDFELQSLINVVSSNPLVVINAASHHTGTYGLDVPAAVTGANFVVTPKLPVSNIISCRFDFQWVAGIPVQTAAANSFGPCVLLQNGSQAGIFMTSTSMYLAYGIATTVPITLAGGTWYTLEVVVDQTGFFDKIIVLLYNAAGVVIANYGAEVAHNANTAPEVLELYNSNTSTNRETYFDNISITDQYQGAPSNLTIASGSQITLGVTQASGAGSGFADLFIQRSGEVGWFKVPSIGNVTSYVLSQWPPPGGAILQALPLVTPVMPAQFRIGTAILGRGLQQIAWTRSMPAQRSNGVWEDIQFPPIDAPPQSRAQQQAQQQWVMILQCLGVNGGTPNCDADAVALPAYEEDALTAFFQPGITPPAGGIWQFDQRYDGETTVSVLDSAGNVIAQPSKVGQLYVGPGDYIIDAVVEVADSGGYPVSDAINGQYSLQQTHLTPRTQLGAQ